MGLVHRATNYGWSEQYNVQIKDDLRDKLIQYAVPIIREAPRIVTLPSIHGKCAIRFRQTWQDATIIGLERNKMIAMASELCWEASDPSTVGRPLDRLFCCDVRTFMDGKFIFEATDATYDHPRKNVRRLVPAANAATEHLDFDLAFLDYTGQLKSTLCGDAFRFMKQNMSANAVCGMTFSYTEDMTDQQAISYLRGMGSAFKPLMIQPYRNGTSKGDDKGAYMIFAVFAK